MYLQRWFKDPFFLPKLSGTGHGAAPMQVVWIGGDLSVEDLPTMLTGRPQSERQRDLDTYILPNPTSSTPEPNSPPLKLSQIKTRLLSLCWPALGEQHWHLWLKDSLFLPPTPSCTACPPRRAGRGEGHPPSLPPCLHSQEAKAPDKELC